MNTMQLAFRKALTKQFSKSIKNSYDWNDFVELNPTFEGLLRKSDRLVKYREINYRDKT